jgi:hypothetical protein
MTGCDKFSQRNRQLYLLMCGRSYLHAHLAVVCHVSFSPSFSILFVKFVVVEIHMEDGGEHKQMNKSQSPNIDCTSILIISNNRPAL